jgi:UPF0042 nucleotide-binding protein
MITLVSFGARYPDPAPVVGRVVDVRHLKNPHRDKALRHLRGVDGPVQAEILSLPDARALLHELAQSVTDGQTVGVCCSFGRHRSVAIVELLAARLRLGGHAVAVEHRDIRRTPRGVVLRPRPH